MKDLREYPRTRYRRAWIVKDMYGIAQGYNGIGCYAGYSHGCVGELFFVRQDADAALKQVREYRSPEDAARCRVQPIMVPRALGPSEHVRAMRIVRAEQRSEWPAGQG